MEQNDQNRRWWERSAVRAWVSSTAVTLVALWAADQAFADGLRGSAVAIVSGFFNAIGWSLVTKSNKP